jgi:hypothetical protein
MELKFTVPVKDEIFAKGVSINVARVNESWERSQLGLYATKSGLYIQHCENNILYVGITIKGGIGETLLKD